MGRGFEVSWSGLKGTIDRGDIQGNISLEVYEEAQPWWTARLWDSVKGTQISKNFEEDKLEQAYDWCVTTIKDYEKDFAGRGSESAT